MKVLNELDQMTQVSTEPVKFPDKKRIALSKSLYAGFQSRPIILFAGCIIDIYLLFAYAGG